MRTRFVLLGLLTICSSFAFGQSATDSVLVISKTIEDIDVVQTRSASFVEQKGNSLVVDMQNIEKMPKFLGTSDPVRYLQSLAGVQTNNETTCGIHIQGCDDYQSMVAINGAPVFYPNHMLGLYSTFISQHFSTLTLEQAMHKGSAPNRIGGLLDTQTKHLQPSRFSFEGNVGIINSDLTFTIPCGKKSALWISARASYISLLYGKLLRFNGLDIGYDFQDCNLTYSYHPAKRDELVFSAFYSHDRLAVTNVTTDVKIPWQNIVGSVYWNHSFSNGDFRSSVSFSGFQNNVQVSANDVDVRTHANFATVEWKNRLRYYLSDGLTLLSGVEYIHYLTNPLAFRATGLGIEGTEPSFRHASEASAYADLTHAVTSWFEYSIGIHASLYASEKHVWGAGDPRVNLSFPINNDHKISLHYGMYHQYFHKLGLVNGGLPADFYVPADTLLRPETAHAVSIAYQGDFYHKMYSLSADVYFKQIYDIAECTGNVLQLLNTGFDYMSETSLGDGRNWGLNVMFKKNSGYVTGYVSYSLGWAKRRLPGIEGNEHYIYSASHERRHDLNIVLNSQVAKRWNIGLMFVLASGLPYTRVNQMYLINGHMVCQYDTYNGAHMKMYHRLDLSCSYDIIQKNDHTFGVNVSLYNVYAHKNQQFVVYRETLRPIEGTMLSTIIPSISFYGKF